MIIDKYFSNFTNLDEFERNHKEFINIVRSVFAKVCKVYNVHIPTSEIGYLYKYIYQQKTVENDRSFVEDISWMEQIGFDE